MGKRFLGKDTSKSNTNKHTKQIQDLVFPLIDKSDIILEILDARYIDETRNPEIEDRIKEKGKKIIYVLSKADLVDTKKLVQKMKLDRLFPFVFVSCIKRQGIRTLRNRIKIEAKRLAKVKEEGRSIYDKMMKVGIIGYPNTGKSSIINILVGKTVSRTSPVAGFTKGVQKIRLSENILLYDSPGIIPHKEDFNLLASIKKHGKIGVATWDKIKDPDIVINEIMKFNPTLFEKHYNIDAEGDAEILIEKLGRQKHFLKKGNLVNMDRTARYILKDWQDGRIVEDEQQ